MAHLIGEKANNNKLIVTMQSISQKSIEEKENISSNETYKVLKIFKEMINENECPLLKEKPF